MNEALLNRIILLMLRQAGSYLMPEDTLRIQAELAMGGRALDSEWDIIIRGLESERYITGVRPKLGGPVRWKITDAGLAALHS